MAKSGLSAGRRRDNAVVRRLRVIGETGYGHVAVVANHDAQRLWERTGRPAPHAVAAAQVDSCSMRTAKRGRQLTSRQSAMEV